MNQNSMRYGVENIKRDPYIYIERMRFSGIFFGTRELNPCESLLKVEFSSHLGQMRTTIFFSHYTKLRN